VFQAAGSDWTVWTTLQLLYRETSRRENEDNSRSFNITFICHALRWKARCFSTNIYISRDPSKWVAATKTAVKSLEITGPKRCKPL
jgi:hypothetical protein